MSKLLNIIRSWGKHLSGEPLEEEQIIRAKICALCPMKSFKSKIDVFAIDKVQEISGYVCDNKKVAPHVITGEMTKGCGCYLPAKIRSNEGGCPLGKWTTDN